jgi:hypothetical protein
MPAPAAEPQPPAAEPQPPAAELQPPAAPAGPPEPSGSVVELRRHTRQTILLAAAVVAGPLVLVNAVGFGVVAHAVAGLREQQENTGAAAVRNRVSRFLTDIQERDWSGAHAQLCASTKRTTPNGTFA